MPTATSLRLGLGALFLSSRPTAGAQLPTAPRSSSILIISSSLAVVLPIGSASVDESFKKETLDVHNQHRATHQVSAMVWDEHCYNTAKSWADQMAASGKFQHGGHDGMGQNLYWSSRVDSAKKAIDAWMAEEADYDYGNPGFSPATGHFTQCVWKGTTKVAMAIATSSHGTYIVAHYRPPGNYMSQFAQNVFPPNANNPVPGPPPPPPPIPPPPPPAPNPPAPSPNLAPPSSGGGDALQEAQVKRNIRKHLAETEVALLSLVDRTTELLQRHPCPDAGCVAKCSFLGCGGAFQCRGDAGGGGEGGGGGADSSSGHWQSKDTTSIGGLPSSSSGNSNTHNSHKEEAHRFICATRHLEEVWKREMEVVGGNDDDGPLWLRQIVSNMDGVTRTYPAELVWQQEQHKQSNGGDMCREYAVQKRPWFLNAISGPKNVVIILDTSGSMRYIDFPEGHECYNLCHESLRRRQIRFNPCCLLGRTRMAIVKPALMSLIEGFTAGDSVGFVKFASRAEKVGGDMKRATRENVARLKQAVEGVHPGGSTGSGTDFGPAITLAMKVFAQGERDGVTRGCKNIIIFFTDGQNRGKNNYAAEVERLQRTLQRRVHIFTYTMAVMTSEPIAISCANEGVWTHINADDDPASVFYNFNLMSAETETISRWTPPYEDIHGQGTVFTVSTTLAIDSEAVGVVAVDIKLDRLWEIAGVDIQSISTSEALQLQTWLRDELTSRSSKCVVVDQTRQPCRLQQLRDRSDEKGRAICPAPAPALATCDLHIGGGGKDAMKCEGTVALEYCNDEGNHIGNDKTGGKCEGCGVGEQCGGTSFTPTARMDGAGEIERAVATLCFGSCATATPTAEPTAEPTADPTAEPTTEPTAVPTSEPTFIPTAEPTIVPTAEPTTEPTPVPTAEPTAIPTADPTAEPAAEPTHEPCSASYYQDEPGECVPLALPILPPVACCCLAAALCALGFRRKQRKLEQSKADDRNKNTRGFNVYGLADDKDSGSDNDDAAEPMLGGGLKRRRKSTGSSRRRNSTANNTGGSDDDDDVFNLAGSGDTDDDNDEINNPFGAPDLQPQKGIKEEQSVEKEEDFDSIFELDLEGSL